MDYFDSVINEVDFHTEKELQANFEDEEKRNELNKEVKECEKLNLDHLDSESEISNDISKLFVSFCFVIFLEQSQPRLILTDIFLSKNQLQLIKFLFDAKFIVDKNGNFIRVNERNELANFFETHFIEQSVTPSFFSYFQNLFQCILSKFKNGSNDVYYDFLQTDQCQLILKIPSIQLFRASQLSIKWIQLKSTRPEAQFLFENLDSLSLEIHQPKNVLEISKYLALFSDINSESKLVFDLDVGLRVKIRGRKTESNAI